ncbi:hypothetical protein ACOME3_003229 [Neoechinorhynchus agilis]
MFKGMVEGDVSRHSKRYSIWCQFDQQLGAAEPTDKERARLWDVRWGDEGCYRAPLARAGDPFRGWVTGLFTMKRTFTRERMVTRDMTLTIVDVDDRFVKVARENKVM